MDSLKTYYGKANVEIKELIETNKKGFIKLEYYGTKKVVQDEFIEYGIEIVKKEYTDRNFIQETSNVTNIAKTEQELEELITILKRNKVTPMSLNDIIYDLIK